MLFVCMPHCALTSFSSNLLTRPFHQYRPPPHTVHRAKTATEETTHKGRGWVARLFGRGKVCAAGRAYKMGIGEWGLIGLRC